MKIAKHSSTLKACVLCACLIPGLLLPGAAWGGLVQNETNSTAYMMYLFGQITDIQAHGKKCVMGFVDFPYFVVEDLNCPIPFFTSGTTVRLYYNSSGKADCCRDCIPNPCSGAKAAVQASQAMDTDRDGIISRAEFLESVKEGFQHADRDRDAALSHEEMSYAEGTKMPMDENGDGGIQLGEAVKTLLRHFDDADADGNGVLTAGEFVTE